MPTTAPDEIVLLAPELGADEGDGSQLASSSALPPAPFETVNTDDPEPMPPEFSRDPESETVALLSAGYTPLDAEHAKSAQSAERPAPSLPSAPRESMDDDGQTATAMQAEETASLPLVVLIVGMRGSGKTTLGRASARLLQFAFADLDEVITQLSGGKEPPQIVKERGWEGFRALEVEALLQCIAGEHTASRPSVIACGGGVVETDRGMEILQRHWPVIFNERHIEDIVEYLECGGAAQAHRASLGEAPRDTYARRLPRYLRCADYWLPQVRGEADPEHPSRCMARLLRMACSQIGDLRSRGPYLGADTFSLSTSSLQDAVPPAQGATPTPSTSVRPVGPQTQQHVAMQTHFLREVVAGVDVIELRVDALPCRKPLNVARQVGYLRKYAAGTHLLYTVRSKDQGGSFEGSEEEYLELLRLGLRLGCELLDVEIKWGPECIDTIVAERRGTLLVGSHHEVDRMPEREELENLFSSCLLNGAASVAKVAAKGETREDAFALQQAGAAACPPCVAFVGICLGEASRLTRLLNRVFCPVVHAKLLIPPRGEIAADEVMECRRTLNLDGPSKQFLVFAPEGPEGLAALKLLPAMLDPALGELDPPHRCRAVAVDTVEEARHMLSLHSVSGAVLVGKLRAELLPYVKASAAATRAGVVDVVTKLSGEVLGECVEHTALRSKLRPAVGRHSAKADATAPPVPSAASTPLMATLLSDPERPIGLVVLPDDAPWESELLAPTARAAQLALVEQGFKVFYHGPRAVCASLPSDVMTISFAKSAGQKLGIDVVDMQRHGHLKVVSITDGLVAQWNKAHPRTPVQNDDVIMEVNGVSGDIHQLVNECQKTDALCIKIKRPTSGAVDVPKGYVHVLDDLASLDVFPRLDVVVLVGGADDGLEARLTKLRHLRPIRQTATPWPSGLSTAAGAALLRAVDEDQRRELVRLFLEQVSACAELWLNLARMGKVLTNENAGKELALRDGFKLRMERELLAAIQGELPGLEPTLGSRGPAGSSLPPPAVEAEPAPPPPPE